jgi:hypothetical protein
VKVGEARKPPGEKEQVLFLHVELPRQEGLYPYGHDSGPTPSFFMKPSISGGCIIPLFIMFISIA